MAKLDPTVTLVGMRLLDLSFLSAAALVLAACSDDGLSGADTDASGGSTGASATAGPSTSGGVTTTDPSTASETNATVSTDPSDPTTGNDTDPGLTGPGTSGMDDSSGGDSSGSSSTGGVTEPECMVDDDCMLIDDCCTCDAAPVGEMAPKCDLDACLIPTCQSLGLGTPAVQCNFGTCEVEEVSCNPMVVTCDPEENPAPDCPKGQAARVEGDCWTGACIPVEFCDVVPSCEACGEDETCIGVVTQAGTSLSCEPIAPSCDGTPNCECMGEVCEAPFDACSDELEPNSGSEISCGCPTC